jgi:hypothetical protein
MFVWFVWLDFSCICLFIAKMSMFASREALKVIYGDFTRNIAKLVVGLQNGEFADLASQTDRDNFRRELLALEFEWVNRFTPDDSKPATFDDDFIEYSNDFISYIRRRFDSISNRICAKTSGSFPYF